VEFVERGVLSGKLRLAHQCEKAEQRLEIVVDPMPHLVSERIAVRCEGIKKPVCLSMLRSSVQEPNITSLCDDLKVALVGLRPISLKVQVESHLLAQERAVPIGLIINELLTNALKYAFPEERAGAVSVHFAREDQLFCLKVTDDGIGIMSDRPPDGSGLGQRLVRSMVSQLEGSYDIVPDAGAPGTVATVRFPAT
jgi:two-component sensor histidine kinase